MARIWTFLISITCLFAASAAAWAQNTNVDNPDGLIDLQSAMDAARDKRKALEAEAKKISAEIDNLTQQMVTLAGEIQTQESGLTRVELELDVLEDDLETQRIALEAKSKDLGTTLAAMQKLSRQPPTLVFLRPVSAQQTSRTAALLTGVVPVLDEQAADIRAELTTMEALKSRLQATQATYQVQLAALNDSQKDLESAQVKRKARRRQLSAEAQREAERIAKLAGEARTLEGLLERLRQERERLAAAPRPKPKPSAPPPEAVKKPAPLFSEARGTMPLPVRGELIGRYGKPFDGAKSEGLWIAARPNAQVVSPYDGQVVFADQFRSYGRLLIIEHSEGYHSVIAGLSRTDVTVGQYVVSGEPIGIMSGEMRQQFIPNNPLGLPVLYLELQRNGRSLNPEPWLMASLEIRSR